MQDCKNNQHVQKNKHPIATKFGLSVSFRPRPRHDTRWHWRPTGLSQTEPLDHYIYIYIYIYFFFWTHIYVYILINIHAYIIHYSKAENASKQIKRWESKWASLLKSVKDNLGHPLSLHKGLGQAFQVKYSWSRNDSLIMLFWYRVQCLTILPFWTATLILNTLRVWRFGEMR